MATAFPYDRYVTGRNFTGRRNERKSLGNLISQNEHVAIYEPENSGKSSLVQQVLLDLRLSGRQFAAARLSLMGIRTLQDFLIAYGSAVIKAVAATPDEYASLVSGYLADTHFVFDGQAFSERGEIISTTWTPGPSDIDAMLALPGSLASRGLPIVFMIEEFQNIVFCDDGNDSLLRALEKAISSQKSSEGPKCTYLFMGSRVNAMKEIFEKRHFFYRFVQHFPIGEVSERDIIDYVVRGFVTSGKVVEKELLLGMCKLFRNNMWYINSFISICDSLSKGYISEPILVEALDSVIALQRPRFKMIMDDLTTFQVNLLRAILEGNKKFSSTEVIRHYALNSSANVKRLKDALCKKEIITFDDMDEPVVLDPLFEYWAKKYYFKIRE